jgi:hypothetical protein
MRTKPRTSNDQLRAAMTSGAADLDELLLASMMLVTHDGTVELDGDRLPGGERLALGISRIDNGDWMLGAYSDPVALLEPYAPTGGGTTPVVPVTGDDLVVLAAANHVGIHVNPGSEVDLRIGVDHVHELAERVEQLRARTVLRSVDDTTLVTMRGGIVDRLDAGRRIMLERELAERGVAIAFVAEYAIHDRVTEPEEFTQLIVVGDADGLGGYDLREDARTVLSFLTGRSTDGVAYASMPHVRHVTEPVLQLVDELPEPLVGSV